MKWILTGVTLAWFVFMLCLSQESGETSGIVTQQLAQQIGDASPKTEQLGYWDQVKRVNRIHGDIRSVAHVAVFFVLAVLLTLTADARRVKLGFVVAFLTVWSVMDEVLKLWAYERHCELADIGKNLAGSLLGFLAGLFLLTLHKREKKGRRPMGQIKVEKNVGGIEGLCVITPAVHGDNRGYFMETYSQRDMAGAGIDITFVQDNQSMSVKGVLRGLHFQKNFPQTKLVRAIRGSVFDVAVDLRPGSATYGKWYGVELTEENKKQFLIPRGFAHGFLVLSDRAEFCYKCDDFYHPNDEGGLAWNDPVIGIQWPQVMGEYTGTASAEGYTLADGTKLNLSDKDQRWSCIGDISR